MIKLRSIAALSFAALLASGFATSEGITDASPSKRIPLPEGASEELKKSIESRPAISISQAIQHEIPKDTNDLIKLINKRNKFRAARDIKTLEQSSVSIRRETLEGVSVNWLMPSSINPNHRNHLFIHLHGGAYLMGAGDAGIQEGIIIAEKLGIAVVSIDYRMPPLHPFPAAVDDVVATYRALLKKHSNQSIAMGGTSAGGGLTLAATLRFKQLDLPLPGALYAGTPWADLSETGDSYFINEGIDRVLVTYKGILAGAARLYADGRDLKDPLLSPVYGDFSGFPPTYLVTGTRDLFLSATALTHRKLRRAGALADLNVYEGVSHADYLLQDLPESGEVFEELNKFISQHLR
jgi:monoterpene epsilon-lactone hydrolase